MSYMNETCSWYGGYAPQQKFNAAVRNVNERFCRNKCKAEYEAAMPFGG